MLPILLCPSLFSFILSFFFSPYGAHPYLHSFPTRRSSDLLVSRRPSAHTPSSIHTRGGTCGHCYVSRMRSEEHTSELQSHSDLVCRLLLEKKKNEEK